ncbi:esterase-like activity of phytase family protein [Acidovorax sp.]|uniref:esterase-like activity of phytase family protein n=1 Tax=Acidovorax sp. TaxID=1872122 RepID=UPI00391EE267
MSPVRMVGRLALAAALAATLATGCGSRVPPEATAPLPIAQASHVAAQASHVAAQASPATAQASHAAAQAQGPALRIIGTVNIPSGIELLGTPLGGLSGIDYDAASDQYLLISDDRSLRAPARVYTARIPLDAHTLQPPQWLQVQHLLHATGVPYPSSRRAASGMDAPDAEAVRWLPGARQFVWTSEGDFARGFGPQMRVNNADGTAVRDIALPASFAPAADRQSGPRNNGTLEGLALLPGGRKAWLAMELPWVQDGPLPTHTAQGGPVRLTLVELATGRALRQIAYQPDAVHHARPLPVGPETVGISEVLADGKHHLLVLERSYSAGAGFSVRLYRIDTRAGTNTLARAQLAPGNHVPVPKTLVADFAALGISPVDNLEGMTWGPVLPGGARTLVFVSDDNFNPGQVTQFIAAQYIPPTPER